MKPKDKTLTKTKKQKQKQKQKNKNKKNKSLESTNAFTKQEWNQVLMIISKGL